MFIPQNVFTDVVRYSPLVSIDLIIELEGRILLGLRNNRPAQGYWFVPGGRIAKEHSLPQAYRYITRLELGVELDLQDAAFLGVYDHFYDDNFSGSPDLGTHYIVLAFKITLLEPLSALPVDQHSAYRYWDLEELLKEDAVHPNTKAYFDKRFIPPGLVAVASPLSASKRGRG
jgi:colanic acid biosynthesis protein WcaH